MSDNKIDDHSGVETTGHEWDGIRELDNPLPRWWLWLFFFCIAVSVVYWVLMPAWPGLHGYTPGILHQSDRVDVVGKLNELKTLRGAIEDITAKFCDAAQTTIRPNNDSRNAWTRPADFGALNSR